MFIVFLLVLIYLFLMISDVQNFSMSILAINMFCFWSVCSVLFSILLGCLFHLVFRYKRPLYVMGIVLLPDVCFENSFSSLCLALICLVLLSFNEQNFNFWLSLIYHFFSLIVIAFCKLWKLYLPPSHIPIISGFLVKVLWFQ